MCRLRSRLRSLRHIAEVEEIAGSHLAGDKAAAGRRGYWVEGDRLVAHSPPEEEEQRLRDVSKMTVGGLLRCLRRT